MPPTSQQRYVSGASSLSQHYQPYASHQPGHTIGLTPPSLGSMNVNSMNNAFSVNGNALSLSAGFGGSALGIPGGTGLGSQAAQMSFNSLGMHPQHNGTGELGPRTNGGKNRIRDVWAGNLYEEMELLRRVAVGCPYVAMNAEFPGVVARPMGTFNGRSDYHYQCMRCNVDLISMYQLGISLFTEDGESPPATIQPSDLGYDTSEARKFGTMISIPTTWQFHFRFSLKVDMYSEISIESSRQAGIDVPRMENEGIDPLIFGSLLMTSGLVCDEDVHWLACHGAYDLGHLTKILSVLPLPDDETGFDTIMKKFFPSIFDIKYLVKEAVRRHQLGQLTPLDSASNELMSKLESKPGLDHLAECLKIKRVGPQHQAGSNSLLTGRLFFKIRENFYGGEVSEDVGGKMYGIGNPENKSQISGNQPNPQQLGQDNLPSGTNNLPNGTPSTPNSGSAGLAQTPGHNIHGGNTGPLTPGGAGGVFGAFQYNGK
ncbi:unnamed protein product [Blumeria hordei]|uniref:poly(A)-specific ribonuclease n=2 Tax=Blumeria hordei TaxID=2867405 RepID=A0A383V030_BLUHO|nr:CCR4-NOT core complex subunit Caf1 [Blumeria hordei DH14]SZF05366.1 unnamed protein product [Blumeria hordei]